MEESAPPPAGQPAPRPRRRVYYVTHARTVPAGAPPARFTVRVKTDDLAVELGGTAEHHHQHA